MGLCMGTERNWLIGLVRKHIIMHVCQQKGFGKL